MKKTTSILIGVASVILLAVFFVIKGEKPTAAPTSLRQSSPTSLASSKPTLKTVQSPVQIAAQKPPNTSSEKVNKCISQTALQDSDELLVAQEYLYELAGFGRVDNENYLNEPQLLAQAQASNTYAMLILGKNYLWHTQMESFQAMSTRPADLPQRENIPRPFDQKTMDKALYWLEQAALQGEFGALDSLSYAYADQMYHVRDIEPIDEDKVQTLLLTSKAYKSLEIWLLPEVFGRNYKLVPQGLSEEQRTEFDKILSQLQTNWTQNRQDLGFDSELRLEIPLKARKYQQLASRACKP